jgi:hypothetical protein
MKDIIDQKLVGKKVRLIHSTGSTEWRVFHRKIGIVREVQGSFAYVVFPNMEQIIGADYYPMHHNDTFEVVPDGYTDATIIDILNKNI